MTKDTIRSALGPHPWAENLVVLETVDSTNTYAKQLAVDGAPHGTVVVANHQTGGRGRMGRQFSSPRGLGVYLTCIWRFSAAPDRLMHLTCVAAEAAGRAVEEASGVAPSIKWINDLVVEKKKLCGILTELVSTPDGIAVICGVGVNCLQQPEDFPPEVASMATSLVQCGGRSDRSAVAAALIRQLDLAGQDMMAPAAWMAGYRSRCITLGKDVQLIRGSEIRPAHVEDLDEQGALVVRLPDGTREIVNSGEVSVRGMYGYL